MAPAHLDQIVNQVLKILKQFKGEEAKEFVSNLKVNVAGSLLSRSS